MTKLEYRQNTGLLESINALYTDRDRIALNILDG